ncbi:Endo-chitosanase [Colletotrichum chlorophyti]|uniref:Endo-chitosanase n=1 Tax=Colletotrichum chlorophyti TaxID=708187 RepID=A0A1Q8RME6_9PEZI|nr:Endo-chitosanase [Colletotrichum chlorophyti]
MLPLAGVLFAVLAAIITCVSAARDIPNNVQDFYNHIRDQKKCKDVLASGFHSADNDSGDFDYCGDYLDKYNIIYLQGKHGQLVNMDVDCDGAQGEADGRCASSTDTQAETTFRDELNNYRTGQRDLNASVHPYVVFGNQGNKPGWPTFNPQDHGVEPLSVMAVVCNNKLVYGVWGDTNGDDGAESMVGEASISLATACYGNGITGNSGHDNNDVLYIAFTGKDAVPGASGANWAASTYDEFETSIADLGNKLVERVGSGCDGRLSTERWFMYFTFVAMSSLLIL